MWAFVDVFRWLSLLCAGCVIVVWFFKKVRPGRGPAGAH
jgi:DHA2 family multidrug resistance protein